ncbi:MAG: DoxX family protein [Gammaproteobacteria bacterium]|nr:DoxX family protein [Gammaproteobacteria bacterium]MCB1923311.1 DoxX family protein [Gammaproteobacteria bacterium]
MSHTNLNAATILGGRVLLSAIFILAGIAKISGYGATQEYMTAMGVPGALLPLVIALEIGAGGALLLGIRARLAAVLLALFSVAAALIFHADLGDAMQRILFMKNLAIAGGLLMVAAAGAGRYAVRPNV